MSAAEYAKTGCLAGLGILAIGFLTLAVPVGGWLLFDALRPRDPTTVLFQNVINDASIRDSFGYPVGGWDSTEVTDRICSEVDRQKLDFLKVERRTASDFWFPAEPEYMADADSWVVSQNKNIFGQCATHSIRYLLIGIQRGTDQCKAIVSVAPTCDL